MTKAQMSLGQIWNMCFGFFGIQIGFGLQNANTSRIFQTLGANIDELAILWIAAPATGLLVQPIIGYFSDRTWTKWGRRRPYFFLGAVLTTLSLIIMPNSPALWVAAGALWIMDASINITIEPFRAFVGDNLPDKQRTTGYAMQSFFIGGGAVFASSLPWMLSNWFGMDNTAAEGAVPLTVHIAFYVGAACLLLAVMWTVFTSKEYSPEELDAFEQARLSSLDGEDPLEAGIPAAPTSKFLLNTSLIWLAAGAIIFALVSTLNLDKEIYVLGAMLAGFGLCQLIAAQMKKNGKSDNGFYEVIEDINRMPKTMRQLAIVQFFSWFPLFAMWIYTTPAVTSFHYGATDVTSKLYNDGADWVGVLMGIYNGVAAIAAIAIMIFANKIRRKYAHAANLALGCIGYISVMLIKDPALLWISMIAIGFAWASIVSLPYSLLAGALPAKKMGVYMGVFNIFIVVPQLLAATLLGVILKTFFDGQAIWALIVGGASFAIAAIATLFVDDPADA